MSEFEIKILDAVISHLTYFNLAIPKRVIGKQYSPYMPYPHCEIKISQNLWPIWKAIPIKK